jgi:hypothetical protein
MNQDTLDFLTAVLDNPEGSVHRALKMPGVSNEQLAVAMRKASESTVTECTSDPGTFPQFLRTVMTRSLDAVDFLAIVEHLRKVGNPVKNGN